MTEEELCEIKYRELGGMTEELVDLLHNYIISLGVTVSRENAQDILLCAMALLQEKGTSMICVLTAM